MGYFEARVVRDVEYFPERWSLDSQASRSVLHFERESARAQCVRCAAQPPSCVEARAYDMRDAVTRTMRRISTLSQRRCLSIGVESPC